jgi:hypothetical protein
MKITLERPELIHILSQSLGYGINDEDVSIQSDPFEVSIRNVQLTGGTSTPKKPEEAIEPESEPEQPAESDGTLSIEDLLRRNEAYGGPKIDQKTVKETAPITRHLGPYETEDPPPITQEEIHAVLRGQNG